MYNEKQKLEFLDTLNIAKSTRESFIAMFNRVQPLEEEWGKDICFADKEETTKIAKRIFGITESGINSRKTLFKRYGKWCINNVEGAGKNLIDISVGNETIKEKMVSSPIHLQKVLNDMFPPEDDNTVSLVFRGFYWLSFMGIPEDYIYSVRNGDVDINDMVIRVGNKEYKIYSESLKTIKKCKELTAFNIDNPNYGVRKAERVSSDILLRGLRANPIKNIMRASLSRCVNNFVKSGGEVKISHLRLVMSGEFYEAYMREVAGCGKPDFTNFAAENLYGIAENINEKNKLTKNVVKLAGSYKRDYNKWKEAFYK